MFDDEICRFCNVGLLEPTTETNKITLDNQEFLVLSHFSVCDCCGIEITNMDQAKENKRLALEIRKK